MKRIGLCAAIGLCALVCTGCAVKDYLEDITADSEYYEPEPEAAPENAQPAVPDTEELNSLLDQLTEQKHENRAETPQDALPTNDDLLHDLMHDDTPRNDEDLLLTEESDTPQPDCEAIDGTVTVYGFEPKPKDGEEPLAVPEAIKGMPVTAIGKYGFYNVDYAHRVTLPGSIIRMGDYAFNGSSLPAFDYEPEAELTVGDYAFSDCRKLTAVRFGSKQYTFGDYCFEKTAAETLTAEQSTLTLGSYCFQDSPALQTAELSGTITVGEYGFRNCEALTALTVTDSTLNIMPNAFGRCGLKKIEITGSTGAIGDYCFMDCPDLETVVIGEGITSLGDCAFSGCRNLKRVELPASLTVIGKNCFADCKDAEIVTAGKD